MYLYMYIYDIVAIYVMCRKAVLRTNILHVYGFDSIRNLFCRGERDEIPKNTGKLSGKFGPKGLDCELLICRLSVKNII